MRSRWRTVLLLALSTAGCAAPPPPAPPAPPPGPQPVAAEGLHNVYRLSDRLYSGSAPDDDAGFASLQQLGVKTVITVDGSAPDVAAARRHGLRYVHVPVGYDGIPKEKACRIARAARDLPGPVYVHCHHGMHRGPAAAACVMLALDPNYTPEAAEAWLHQAGTDPRYRGLIELPHTLPRPTAADLDAAPADFPPVADVPDLTRLMVAVDARWDAMKEVKAAGWKAPPAHPDADPPHEAVQLRELFREAARLPDATRRGPEVLALLREAESAAGELETALRASDATAAKAAFERSQGLCARCHARHRD